MTEVSRPRRARRAYVSVRAIIQDPRHVSFTEDVKRDDQRRDTDLEILYKPLQERHEMLGFANIPRDGLLEKVFR